MTHGLLGLETIFIAAFAAAFAGLAAGQLKKREYGSTVLFVALSFIFGAISFLAATIS